MPNLGVFFRQVQVTRMFLLNFFPFYVNNEDNVVHTVHFVFNQPIFPELLHARLVSKIKLLETVMAVLLTDKTPFLLPNQQAQTTWKKPRFLRSHFAALHLVWRSMLMALTPTHPLPIVLSHHFGQTLPCVRL